MSRAQLGGQRLFVGAASTGSSEPSFSLREARTRPATVTYRHEETIRLISVRRARHNEEAQYVDARERRQSADTTILPRLGLISAGSR
jgi:hypothetical protein